MYKSPWTCVLRSSETSGRVQDDTWEGPNGLEVMWLTCPVLPRLPDCDHHPQLITTTIMEITVYVINHQMNSNNMNNDKEPTQLKAH
jgi:hypothetical protein